MTPSALEYLDSAWEITVLPQPKAPGMEHVPAGAGGRWEGQGAGAAPRLLWAPDVPSRQYEQKHLFHAAASGSGVCCTHVRCQCSRLSAGCGRPLSSPPMRRTSQHGGEQGVQHALPGQQRGVRQQLLGHGARRAHLHAGRGAIHVWAVSARCRGLSAARAWLHACRCKAQHSTPVTAVSKAVSRANRVCAAIDTSAAGPPPLAAHRGSAPATAAAWRTSSWPPGTRSQSPAGRGGGRPHDAELLSSLAC